MKQTTKPTANDKPAPKPRGFAAMDPKLVRKITRLGGLAVSKDRQYMRELGARGGAAPRKTKKAA